jgi:hypothetical protein
VYPWRTSVCPLYCEGFEDSNGDGHTLLGRVSWGSEPDDGQQAAWEKRRSFPQEAAQAAGRRSLNGYQDETVASGPISYEPVPLEFFDPRGHFNPPVNWHTFLFPEVKRCLSALTLRR